MKFLGFVALAVSLLALAPNAQAKAHQYVVVVADGVSPQLLNYGQDYLRKAEESPEFSSGFTALGKVGRAAPVTTDSLGEMKGLLETAHAAGFKTGLVTTGDVTKEAPFWYNVTSDKLGSDDAHYDVLGGGGRTKLGNAGEAVTNAGGTYLGDANGIVREIKGRILAAQADEEMSYELDRNPEIEGSLAELAGMALDSMGDNDTPFVLVIHDTLIQKALKTKDTPALFEQFRALSGILDDVVRRREDNSNLSVTAFLPGADIVPNFAPNANVTNTYTIVSSLGRTFHGAGEFLKDADAQTIAFFIDPEGGEYREWKPTMEDVQKILAGQLSAEDAVRDFFEDVLQISYDPATPEPIAVSVGLDTKAGLVAALKAAVSTPVPVEAAKDGQKTN